MRDATYSFVGRDEIYRLVYDLVLKVMKKHCQTMIGEFVAVFQIFRGILRGCQKSVRSIVLEVSL